MIAMRMGSPHWNDSSQHFGLILGNTAQFGKRLRREILFQDKVWKTQEYCMYFKFFKLQDWGKRSGEGRRRNCAVLP